MKIFKQSGKVKGMAAALVLGLALVACTRTLDIAPPFDTPADVALNSADNLEAAINGAYSALQNGNFYGGALRIIPDALSDQSRSVSIALERGNLNFYDVYRRFLFAQANGVWTTGYQAINRANNVINAIENESQFITVNDQNYRDNKDRLRGEGLFIRAAAHWELVRLYGKPYGPEKDAPNSGVVLRLKPSVGREGVARSTTQQVYTQVINDLRAAIELLPDDFDGTKHPTSYGGRRGGRATKDAARALLAKVFFQQGTVNPDAYPQALTLINEVIGAAPGTVAKYPLDPMSDASLAGKAKTMFVKKGNEIASEVIWQIVNNADPASRSVNSSSGTLANVYSLRIESGVLPPIISASGRFIETATRGIPYSATDNVVQFGSSDKRFQLFFNRTRPEGSNEEHTFVDKYYVVDDVNFGAVPIFNVPIIRSAELLLDRAEILYLQGDESGARADLNALRATRITDRAEVPSTVTGDVLLRVIRDERVRELAFEGDRLHDLRRRAASGEAEARIIGRGNSAGSPNNREGTDRILQEADVLSNQLLLLIPDAELFSNPAIVQN